MAYANPIHDLLLRTGIDSSKEIDLRAAFGDSFTTFTVRNSDGTVVATEVVDGVLKLLVGEHGFSDLVVTATDDAGLSATDSFRVRVAGENAFTVAVLPDTQNYTSNPALNATFGNMTNWLADNAESRHISFVVGVGDVTDNNNAAQWAIAEEALRQLDGKIPYSMLPGNHDQGTGNASDHSTGFLDNAFSPDKQAVTNPGTFGGVYDREPDRSANTYHTFEAPDGTDWLVLSLEFGPRDDVLRWAGDVIENHLDHRVILASHTLTTFAGRSDPFAGQIGAAPVQGYGVANSPEGANDGEGVYRFLTSKYPNVAMTLSGHVLGDSAETNLTYSQHGNTVVDMFADYQNGSATELVTRGGEGAIRLLVIDPDAGTISTETYFTERDAYLTGFRGKEELDRDGLTGPYRGHQEVISGLDLKTPVLKAQAAAGTDLFVETTVASGTASVVLDAGGTLNRDLVGSYQWRDADGRVLSEEAVATVDLAPGKHVVTLAVTDRDGNVTTDEKLLVVTGTDTLLVDSFNDGDARGWGPVPIPSFSESLEFGSAQDMGLPALPGGESAVLKFPASKPTVEGFLVRPDFGTPDGQAIKSYTLVLDMLVTGDNAGKWFALLQTDPAQSSANDADFLINKSGGIGINGSYTGNFAYDAWHRVALTVTEGTGGNSTLAKYIDGALVGTQSMPTSRFQIDPEKGFLVFSDNAPNGSDLQTQPGVVSSLLFADRAMSASEITGLGGPKAPGILTSAPTSGQAVQFDFAGATPFEPTVGSGKFTVLEPESILENTRFGTTEEFGTAPLPGGSDMVMSIPATPVDQGYLVKPGFAPADGGMIESYTYIVDVYAPAAKNHWFALLQTDPTNASDADFLVNMSGGIGINGTYTGSFNADQWQRIALTVADNGDGTATLSKYLEGNLVGTQSMPTSRYAIDPEKGFLIFSDDAPQALNFQTVPAQVNSVFFTDRVLTTAEIGELGGAKTGGIVAADKVDPAHAVQFDFTGGNLSPSFGPGALELWDRETSGTYLDGWTVKGTVNAPGAETGEGALHDRSDAADKMLLWRGEDAKDWSNYRYDVTLTSTDNDEIGVTFYYQDEDNYYRFSMNTQTMERLLVKVQDGAETVLASERAGYRFNDALELSVIATDGRIDVLLEGKSVFGGPVVDPEPLGGGTIGVLSNGQKSSIFDDVLVSKIALTAHGEAATRVIADPGESSVDVAVTAGSSFGPDEIVSYRWLVGNDEVGTGREAVLDLVLGTEAVTLEVTDASGKVSSDIVQVDVVGDEAVMMRESFGSATLSPSWRILDEGTLEGPSAWAITDGRLVQSSNIYSEQLLANGPSNADIWQRGWSPLGDGTYVLRKGTTALFEPEGEDVSAWKDYSVETTFQTPDDDGVGLVFYYEDPANHYKLELDAQRGVWTLVRLENGIEEVLGQAWGGYVVGQETHLRVDILDHQITAYIDGEAVFPLPIEDRAHEGGTFGLYSWGSQGVSFDDVAVVNLAAPANAAPQIISNGGEALALGVDEDRTTVTTVEAVDADGDAVLLSLSGADAALFEIAEDGVVTFVEAPDHENPSDANGDNVYEVLVTASDGELADTQAITITVADVNEVPTLEVTAVGTLSENTAVRTKVADIVLIDPDVAGNANVLTVSDPRFEIVGLELFLRDGQTVDFETEPTIDLTVASTDGALVASANVSITVGDVGEGGGTPPVTPPGGGGTAPATNVPTAGPDMLNGTPGMDNLISAGSGNDTVNAGAGNDAVFGNQDNDQLFGNEGRDTVFGGQGNDSVYGGQGNDEAHGNLGDDVVYGNKGDDRLFGNEGNDQLFGNEGDDFLHGGQGNDSLYGGQGDDVLNGGAGDDILFGGLGSDVFAFDGGQGNDVVADFRFAEGDRLDLSGQDYVLGQNNEGQATLFLESGGTVVLLGLTQDQFQAGFISA